MNYVLQDTVSLAVLVATLALVIIAVTCAYVSERRNRSARFTQEQAKTCVPRVVRLEWHHDGGWHV